MNLQYAETLLQTLANLGVGTICLCPGGRNAPFVEILDGSSGFEVVPFFDERSAGFFALGRAQRDQRPAAIVTTSGTAVAELLPSMIEAFYTRTPLVVLSADRPKAMRGTGAPQTIEQPGIFGNYVQAEWDLEPGDPIDVEWNKQYGMHINVCFDEPILSGESHSKEFTPVANNQIFERSGASAQEVHQWLNRHERPLVVLGGLNTYGKNVFGEHLSEWKVPFYIEGPSGLREGSMLSSHQIQSGDRFVLQELQRGSFDSVLRLGDVPTAKFWRELEFLKIPTLSLSNRPFAGGRGGVHFQGSCLQIKDALNRKLSFDGQGILQRDKQKKEQIDSLLERHGFSEPAAIKKVSQLIPKQAQVYLGNSLPIRLWDLVAQHKNSFHVRANRGANGIDGQLSTAFGRAEDEGELWILLGDLTLLYDLQALTQSGVLRRRKGKTRLVVVNNLGGQIFSRLYRSPLFLNQHQTRFQGIAETWGWDYQPIENLDFEVTNSSTLTMIELRPDENRTRNFWAEYDQLWKK